MKKSFEIKKNILKYILIFILVIFVALRLLIITAKIPKQAISKNMKESVGFFKEHIGIDEIQKRREYTSIHYYADSILLNIIYCIDSDNPVESVIWAKYYETVKADINRDFITVVENDNNPNQQYMRYWHGSMVILRPLFVFFNIEQIYLINKIVMWGLAIILLIILLKKCKILALAYITAMIMIAFPIVPMCLEYIWTFYIMIISSIIAILIEKKGNSNLFILFFINGMLTCYFDFLTTEIITLFVPVIFVIYIRKKEERLNDFKEGFLLLVKISILWGIAYSGMWFAKWILSSIILKTDITQYVKDNVMLRINGLQGLDSYKELYSEVIFKNWHTLYPINIVKRTSDLIIGVTFFIITILICFDWRNINKKWIVAILLIISAMPYIRYLILANHSYRHAFFTFRSQIITIICIVLIFAECLNYKILFKEVKLKKIWKKSN